MSVIIAVAYGEVYTVAPQIVTWEELRLISPVPARVASALLPKFHRWRHVVEPVFERGDIVGIRISSRLSPRFARRIRAAVQSFMLPASEADHLANERPPERWVVSLSKHGLHIPERNVASARDVLERLADDIELQYDSDEESVVGLLVPCGTDLKAIYRVLEMETVTLERSDVGHRPHLLSCLRSEMEALAAAAPRRS